MFFRVGLSFVAVLLSAAASSSAAELTARQVEAEALRAFEAFKPAGMAVAVIQGGEVTYAGGFGVRRAGGDAPVDADTVFALASMTKSVTAAALALLVDEGKLDWDDPVVRHLPQFRMADDFVTRHMTVRDLLVHRSGLPLGAGDLLTWPDASATADEVIAALPHFPISEGFRNRFVYDNSLYIVAGAVIEAVGGRSWAETLERRLLRPLGMTSCATEAARVKGANLAVQHARSPGGDSAKPLDDLGSMPDPAGSLHCSVADVAKWVQFQLRGGKTADGAQLVSEAQMREMHTGVTPLAARGALKRLGRSNLAMYGLGWFIQDFHGRLLVHHGGMAPGGITDMAMLPELGAAVIVLTNDMTPAAALSGHLLNAMAVEGAPNDWIADQQARMARRAAEAPGGPKEATPPAGAKPAPSPLDAYAGTYRDPWYGEIVVRKEGEGLVLHLTRSKLLRGPLLPFDGDVFLARWPDRDLHADALVTFTRGADGAVEGMRLRAAHDGTDFSYDYHDLKPARVE